MRWTSGLAEIIAATNPPLTQWWALLNGLTPDDQESDLMVGHFNLLNALVERRLKVARDYAIDHVRSGRHWRYVMTAVDNDALGLAVVAEQLPRMSDRDISWIADLGTGVWRSLLAQESRVREVLRAKALETTGGRWLSLADYSSAMRASERWRVLEFLIQRGDPTADQLLVDGLWDAEGNYRARCVWYADVSENGVTERLQWLAMHDNTVVRSAAETRLRRQSRLWT